jgi:uncharacterized protein (DUF1778 family)
MKAESAPRPAPMQDNRATFNARLTPEMKAHLQRAADMRGQTLTDFVLGAAYERATVTIEESHMIRLTERDAAVFAAALEQAPLPDPAVIGRFVAAHHKSRTKSLAAP